MARVPNIDRLLKEWPYQPDAVSVRMAKGMDGREVIQMRIEMGVLQLETTGRPDGERPGGESTILEFLSELVQIDGQLAMTPDQCAEVDREFVQFYHRRVCWLALREFANAVRDADHTLALMDFCQQHSPDEAWTVQHEQYRPFVLFHRIQAAALNDLEDDNPETAVEAINQGLDQLRDLFNEFEVDGEFEENELVVRLIELRESLREKFEVGKTLQEQLSDAIAHEEYEEAARIRDQIALRTPNTSGPNY
ncbi:MAG: UvrB/UvrC motif-containing protein [Planctomycetales bacterium]|nr:UvrB/UvrC motif-containing protein [Planctomycetales bacterium]